MKWLNGKKLVIIITIVGILIVAFPLYLFGVSKSFYINPDPDLVYITNAILFLKSGGIAYIDHPGTPTIMLITLLALPLKLISNVLFHQNFTHWAFNNYEFLTFYLRVFMLLTSSVAIYLFTNLLNTVSKSKLITLIGFLLIFSSGILWSSTFVAPEATSILLAAIWLCVFVRFVEKRNNKLNILLIVISGIAVANKFTNVFLFIPSLVLPLFVTNTKIPQKVRLIFVNLITFVATFIVGILPVFSKIQKILAWALSLFNHSGKYGEGTKSIFYWKDYSSSILSLVQSYPFVFITLIVSIIAFIVLAFNKKFGKKDLPTLILFALSFIGFFIFAKYSEIRYNYVNILLIIFCSVIFFTKISNVWVKKLLPIFLIVFMFVVGSYFKVQIAKRNFLGDETDNSYMHYAMDSWTPFWSGNVFKEEIDGIKKP